MTGGTPVDPATAVLDLTTAQQELTAAVSQLVATQEEIVAAIKEQAQTQRDQTAATRVLHRGVQWLVGIVIVGIALAAVVGITQLLMSKSLVNIAHTNRDNGQVTRQNSDDLKAQLALIESVTGPEAVRRQGENTRTILRNNAEEVDCRSRRQHVRLPAPDPAVPCKDQTDPSVYPGVANQQGSG